MVWVELLVVLLFIFLGARISGIGIGFAVAQVSLSCLLFWAFRPVRHSFRSMLF